MPRIRICGNSDEIAASKIMEKLKHLGLKLQRVALACVD